MSTSTCVQNGMNRRTALKIAAGATTAGAVAGIAEPATAQTTGDLGTWFEDVENYDGVVDKTGTKTVHITVGASGNGGSFAFSPAAVRIDSGTTVVWEWSGKGGTHNVYDDEVGYESDLLSEAGATYALTFDGEGISTYACAPHELMGMKGAIAVGDLAASEISITPGVAAVGGSLLMALLSPLAFGVFLFLKGTGDPPDAGQPAVSVEAQPSENSQDRDEREAAHIVDSNSIN